MRSNKFSLICLVLMAFTAAASAEDRTCPEVVLPIYPLERAAPLTRIAASALGYGLIYIKYGATYLRAKLTSAEPPPPSDLYPRAIVTERRALCPGDAVLFNGTPATVVDAIGRQFDPDPIRRAVLDLPVDATNLIDESSARIEIAIGRTHEFASSDQVAVALNQLDLPPPFPGAKNGIIQPGDMVAKCGETPAPFRRVFARPGELVRDPQNQVIEYGAPGHLAPLKDLCVNLPPARHVPIGLRVGPARKYDHGRITGYRGFDRVVVEFPDRSTEEVHRGRLTAPPN